MTNRVINIFAFVVLTILWLAFGAALLFDNQLLKVIWQSFCGWPLVGQIGVSLLTLPLVVGLWIWQAPWPVLLRLILVAGLAWVTIFTFWPGKGQKPAAASSARV